jgi:hypothetical protein
VKQDLTGLVEDGGATSVGPFHPLGSDHDERPSDLKQSR